MTERLYATVGNYYGTPYVREDADGQFFIGIDDYGGESENPISKEFFEAFKKEFKDTEK